MSAESPKTRKLVVELMEDQKGIKVTECDFSPLEVCEIARRLLQIGGAQA